jgi:hypothetical protein
MTAEEVSKLVAVLAAHYPTAKLTRDNIRAYETALADLDHQVSQRAVLQIVKTSTFFPSIAEIRAACVLTLQGPTRSGIDAYASLTRAIRRHGRCYGGEEPPKFSDLLIAKCLGVWGSWNDACNAPSDDAAGRARFIELYDSLARTARTDAMCGRALPQGESTARIVEMAASIGRRA